MISIMNINEKMYIFTSEERGGIPIYFSKSKDNKSFNTENLLNRLANMVNDFLLFL